MFRICLISCSKYCDGYHVGYTSVCFHYQLLKMKANCLKCPIIVIIIYRRTENRNSIDAFRKLFASLLFKIFLKIVNIKKFSAAVVFLKSIFWKLHEILRLKQLSRTCKFSLSGRGRHFS